MKTRWPVSAIFFIFLFIIIILFSRGAVSFIRTKRIWCNEWCNLMRPCVDKQKEQRQEPIAPVVFFLFAQSLRSLLEGEVVSLHLRFFIHGFFFFFFLTSLWVLLLKGPSFRKAALQLFSLLPAHWGIRDSEWEILFLIGMGTKDETIGRDGDTCVLCEKNEFYKLILKTLQSSYILSN